MTTSFQEEQADRREYLENEKRLRGTTLSQFAQSDAAEDRGRFTAHEKSTVIGADATPKYPAAFQQRDPVPNEEPLGVDINAIEPTGTPAEVQASIDKLTDEGTSK